MKNGQSCAKHAIGLNQDKKGNKIRTLEFVPVYLAKKAFGSKKNARGLRDCVRRDIEEKLANAIVFNQDEDIKTLAISTQNDEIKIKIN